MSTYLVAVVVGDFDYVEDKTGDGVVVRVYTPVGVKEQGSFALQVATKVIPYYNRYFQIDYPLPKIDLVAIADFSAGNRFFIVSVNRIYRVNLGLVRMKVWHVCVNNLYKIFCTLSVENFLATVT